MNVLYVAGEGAHGLRKRVQAWEAHHGATIPSGALTILPRAVDLFSGAEVDVLMKVVEERRIGLVVFDTLRRMSGRAKENESDMGVVVSNIDRVKEATEHGSVVVVAHTNKDDKDSRGYSGIEDDADIVWAMKRDEDEEVVNATLKKMKDGVDGLTVTLRPQAAAESIVLTPAQTGSGISAGGRAEVSIVEALDASHGMADPTGPQLQDAAGLNRTTFYRALKDLKRRGVVESLGKGKDTRYRLREDR